MKTLKRRAVLLLTATLMGIAACKKNNAPTDATPTQPDDPGNGGAVGAITAPTDPSIAATQGFFLSDWAPKTFTVPATQAAPKPADVASITATADFSVVLSKVSKYMYGNNMNPFTGQFTDAATVNNLKNLSPNIIRAPGGSLSDVYFWNALPGKAPADAPATLLNSDGSVNPSTSWMWSGKVTDSWSISLDNYYSLLQKINSTGIITVNYGYARYGTGPTPVQTAAHLAADWVRYDKGRTKYWEIGNECYGNWEAGYRIDVTKNRDGQPAILTGDLYGKHFLVFADSMRKAATQIGVTIQIGAILHESADSNSGSINGWNPGVLGKIGNAADFFIVHNYYTNFNENSSASTIFNTAGPSTFNVMNFAKAAIQTAGVTVKPIALTEWNIFSAGSKQQISNVAGVHAVMVLGEVIKNQYGQADRWDLANGWDAKTPGDDHGLFSYGQPNVPDFTPRPAFYYMYYFQKFFGDRMISSSVTGSTNIVSYASSFSSGQAGMILVNTGASDQAVNVSFQNFYTGSNYYYYTLQGGNDNGEFSGQVMVNGNGPTINFGGPASYATLPANSTSTSGGIKVTVPARGAVFLVVDKKN